MRPRLLTEAGDDARNRGALLVGQCRRGRLPGQRLALGGRGPLPAGRPAERSNEVERTGRRRAVVVGDPQGEVDEGRRDLVEHPPDGRNPDPTGDSTPTSTTTPRVELRPSRTLTTAPLPTPSGTS